LETKVTELEKSSESTSHENGLLRAQVQRLQLELREYRKRLSLTSMLGRSPPTSGNNLQTLLGNANGNGTAGAFNFDFPKFGSLPTMPFTPSSTTSPPATNGSIGRTSSTDGRDSPKSQARASLTSNGSSGKSSIDSQNGSSPAFNDSFNNLGTPLSTGIGESKPGDAQVPDRVSSDSSTTNTRMFVFNSTNSSSPSASSNSHFGNNASSSCGTSPEPSNNSPATANKDSTLDTINENGFACHTGADGEISFCEKLNMACGNIRDPTPRLQSISNDSPAPGAAKSSSPGKDGKGVGGVDYFANQNGGQFDPVLFGDYHQSNAAIVGDGDFTGGFFNDALPTSADWGSQFSWNDLTGSSMRTGLTPAVQKSNPLDPLQQADALVSGIDEDEVVPGEDTSQMLSCHKIWYDWPDSPSSFSTNPHFRDKIQEREEFKNGNLDIDGLCNELRSKARCSETGVVIDQKDVDAALQRLPASRANSASLGTPRI
jgi:AP-1-like factor